MVIGKLAQRLGVAWFATLPVLLSAAELPLVPDTMLEYTVSEATWVSVDVHPNGTTLVMDVLGDLYTLPMAGGSAQPLTKGQAFDSQPVYSPDGDRIAFVSDRDGQDALWMLDVARDEFTKLSDSDNESEFASPHWAPDGSHVIVSKGSWAQHTYELWAYHLDGGTGVQITKAKAQSDTPRNQRHNALGAHYSRDGRYLYFARKYGGYGYNIGFPQWQIARRDLTKGIEDGLTQAPGSAFRPVVSPDGEWLVYATRHEQATGLRLRNLVTGADDWLAHPLQRDDQESRFTRDVFPGFAFTPSGDSIVTTRDGHLIRIDLATGKLSQIPFTVAVNQPVTKRLNFPYRTGLGPVKARVLSDGVLSPDGKRLAFTAFTRVYVYDFESGESRPISPDHLIAGFPSWSPKGNELIYVDWSANGGHIYRQRVRGSGAPRRLTEHAGYYMYPAWSPDGKRVVALRGSTHARLSREDGSGIVAGSDVVWLPSAGGEVSLVMPSRGLSRPHFGPDPERIYLHLAPRYFARSGSGGIVSVRYDGTDRQEIVTAKGPGPYGSEDEVPAEFMQLAPDGMHVLIKHANQIYLSALFNVHLRKQKIGLKNPANPTKRLTDVGADFVGWSPAGDEIVWTVGNHVYRRALVDVDFRPKEQAETSASDQGSLEGDDERDNERGDETGEPDGDQTDNRDGDGDGDGDGFLEQQASVVGTQIEIYRPRYKPQGSVALTHATLITMQNEEVIKDGVIVIEGDRIAALGPASEVSIPSGAHQIDLQGRFIVPGFVDTHAHFNVSRDIPMSESASFLANLAYGVTTGMDVQPMTVDVIVAQDLVDAGLMIGPRAFSTGPGVFSNNLFRSAEQARAVLSRYRDHYGVHNIKAYISGSRMQRQWLIQAARELRLMPTTEGALDMKLDLTHMIDGFSGNEHNLPLPDLYDDVIELAARTKIAYTPTLLVSYGAPWGENFFYSNESPHTDAKLRHFTPYPFVARRTLRRAWFHDSEYMTDRIAGQAKKVVERGGQVGVGAHGQLQGLGYHWEMRALESGGFTPMQVLQSATIMGAKMLGLASDIGSLETGKLADLVVLEKSPLQEIRHSTSIEYVVKGGQIYDAETLDEVWPRPRPLAPMWWHTLEPSTAR